MALHRREAEEDAGGARKLETKTDGTWAFPQASRKQRRAAGSPMVTRRHPGISRVQNWKQVTAFGSPQVSQSTSVTAALGDGWIPAEQLGCSRTDDPGLTLPTRGFRN